MNLYFQDRICQENVPTDGSHYWKSNLHILQSGFVRICLKCFFLEGGDFGRFCFNFLVSLCEQSMILLGMFYQQYILRQPNGTWYIPVMDSCPLFIQSWTHLTIDQLWQSVLSSSFKCFPPVTLLQKYINKNTWKNQRWIFILFVVGQC